MAGKNRASYKRKRFDGANKCFSVSQTVADNWSSRHPYVECKKFYDDYVAVAFCSVWTLHGVRYERRITEHCAKKSVMSRMKLGEELTDFRIRRVETLDHKMGDMKTRRVYLGQPVYYRYELSTKQDLLLNLSFWAGKNQIETPNESEILTLAQLKQLR